MKIGIFGGTFNPPHIGHLIAAEVLLSDMKLDKIIFIPSYISPHKQLGEEESATHRLEMVRRELSGNNHFEVSDFEIQQQETSYTYKTLEYFSEKYLDAELYLIIGMDNFAGFHTWKNPEKIVTLSSLIVINRPDYPLPHQQIVPDSKLHFVTIPDIGISSSLIRERVQHRQSIRYLVPDSVSEYIIKNKLYK